MNDGTRLRRLGGIGVVAAVAIALWLVLSGGSDQPDGPEAINKVAGWLEEESECPEGVELEASRVPVGPHGPPGTFFQIFGELPEAGALTSCTDTLGGYIGWFRFRSVGDMDGALRRHPEMTKLEPICTRGRELLIDSLLGNDRFFPEFCRRLDFEVGSAAVAVVSPRRSSSGAPPRLVNLEGTFEHRIRNRNDVSDVVCEDGQEPDVMVAEEVWDCDLAMAQTGDRLKVEVLVSVSTGDYAVLDCRTGPHEKYSQAPRGICKTVR